MHWQIYSQITEAYRQDRLHSQLLPLLLERRGVGGDIDAFLKPRYPDIEHFLDFGIEEALFVSFKEILATTNGEILVYGDYDADGICASAIMTLALQRCGKKVHTYVPDRRIDGYGMKPASLAALLKKYPEVELVVTVDQGIVAHEAVAFLKQEGKRVVITDHHHAHAGLPDADLVIHTTATSGSGVAWLVARYGLGLSDASLLEMAAIGTITDLLPLVGFNRSLVMHGLASLAATKHLGLQALLNVCGIASGSAISTYHVGFQIGPRLNAAGRLELADPGLKLMLANSVSEAEQIAVELDTYNKTRQDQTLTMVAEALAMIDETSMGNLITVASTTFDEGIIGLVASKLVERYHRPAIVMAVNNQLVKGSARSVSGVSMIDLLSQGKALYETFGGHQMAGGFSIQQERMDDLQKLLHTHANAKIDRSTLEKKLKIDVLLPFDWIVPELVAMFEGLAPFGMGNAKPVFAVEMMQVKDKQLVGGGKHLKLWIGDERRTLPAIGFGMGEQGAKISIGNFVDVAFAPSMEEWNGRRYLQLSLHDVRSSEKG